MQGHIHKRVRVDKSGKERVTWYVVLELQRRENGSRQQKWHGGFRTKKEAEAVRARLVNEFNTGLYIPPSDATLRDWAASDWLPTIRGQIKASTFDSYTRNMNLHVLPALGGAKLKNICAPHLDRLYATLGDSGSCSQRALSPKTIRYIHTIIHKCLSDAVRAGLLGTNPAERARPPKLRNSSREIRAWTAPQLRTFLHLAAKDRLYAAFHLAALTGMRRGEVLGLMWKDVDFQSARLSVRRGLISVGYRVTLSSPKTHQARVIDLDAETLQVLRNRQELQAREQDRWGHDYESSDYVFTREDGSHVHPESLSDRFEVLQKESDLPKIRLHDLRHTHASIA